MLMLLGRNRKRKLAYTVRDAGLAATVVIFVFVALGGPLRSTFEKSVSTETLGRSAARAPAMDKRLASQNGNFYPNKTRQEPKKIQLSSAAPAVVGVSIDEDIFGQEKFDDGSYRDRHGNMVAIKLERSAVIALGMDDIRKGFKEATDLILRVRGRISKSNLSDNVHHDCTSAKILWILRLGLKIRNLKLQQFAIS